MDKIEYTEEFTFAYKVCALWASTDEDGEALDKKYSLLDIAPVALEEIEKDCCDFVESQWEKIQNLNPEQCGHDFFLTRNGHGVGFWDRGLGKLGDELTEWAHSYGSMDLYVGDDNKVYCS